MRKVRLLWLTPFLALALSWWSVASATVTDDAKDDANWITQAQFGDGAIANHVDRMSIWPYEGNYAAWGLAVEAARTGDFGKADRAWKWLFWYQKHQDANGFVQHYRVESGKEFNTGDEDSTDGTSGVFLEAALAAYNAKPRDYIKQLKQLHPAITKAVGAIEATMDTDGLTWAKPTWHVKYLMDNAEAYGGLRAAVTIANTLGDTALATRAQADAQSEYNGIQSLWDPSADAYDWAKHADGYVPPMDWTVLYPDSVEEMWVVTYGAADPSHVSDLVSQFAQNEPNWDQPQATVNYWDGTTYPHAAGYWPVVGWAFLRTGDPSDAQAGAQSIRTAAIADNRHWPFTTGNAGQLIDLELGIAPS